MMNTLLSRIEQLAENEGIKITTLERVIGASKGVLSRAINNNTDIQAKWLQQIVENYPNYSPRWLLTGKGHVYEKASQIGGYPESKSGDIQNPLSVTSDLSENSNDDIPPDKEPRTTTGIPLSQVKAKVYATLSDEEIDRTISAMMERQLMEMYEEGRIYPRKAVEQIVVSLQESNQKLLTENAELKAEIHRMQLKLSDRHGPEADLKK